MEQAISYRDAGKVVFKVLGVLLLLSFLAFNPLVLHHRFWNTERVLRSVVSGSLQLSVGMGLIAAKRWATLMLAALSVYAASVAPNDLSDHMVVLRLVLLTPAIVTLTFWRSSESSITRRDVLLMAGAVLLGGFVEYIAFLSR